MVALLCPAKVLLQRTAVMLYSKKVPEVCSVKVFVMVIYSKKVLVMALYSKQAKA